MFISNASYDFIESSRWKMRVTIEGEGLEQRAAPIVAQVGEQPIQAVMPLLDQAGIMGFLAEEPAEGDELLVGYLDGRLANTGLTYTRPVA